MTRDNFVLQIGSRGKFHSYFSIHKKGIGISSGFFATHPKEKKLLEEGKLYACVYYSAPTKKLLIDFDDNKKKMGANKVSKKDNSGVLHVKTILQNNSIDGKEYRQKYKVTEKNNSDVGEVGYEIDLRKK